MDDQTTLAGNQKSKGCRDAVTPPQTPSHSGKPRKRHFHLGQSISKVMLGKQCRIKLSAKSKLDIANSLHLAREQVQTVYIQPLQLDLKTESMIHGLCSGCHN